MSESRDRYVACAEMGMTQSETAKYLGVTPVAVSRAARRHGIEFTRKGSEYRGWYDPRYKVPPPGVRVIGRFNFGSHHQCYSVAVYIVNEKTPAMFLGDGYSGYCPPGWYHDVSLVATNSAILKKCEEAPVQWKMI